MVERRAIFNDHVLFIKVSVDHLLNMLVIVLERGQQQQHLYFYLLLPLRKMCNKIFIPMCALLLLCIEAGMQVE